MKLLYFCSSGGNFGDDLNAWLWPRLFPGCFDDDASEVFVGIGTILDGRIPVAARRKIVFGAGVRSPASVPRLDATWDLRFVRGPLSARALGEGTPWISDGAIALSLLDWDPPASTGRLLLAPHFHTVRDHPYLLELGLDGVDVLDPRVAPEVAIARIRAASGVIAESLHAAIVADQFRVPWARVMLHSWRTETPEVARYKWRDWGSSLSVDVDPLDCGGLARGGRRFARRLGGVYRRIARDRIAKALEACRGGSRWTLSPDSLLRERVERVAREVESLRGDLRDGGSP